MVSQREKTEEERVKNLNKKVSSTMQGHLSLWRVCKMIL